MSIYGYAFNVGPGPIEIINNVNSSISIAVVQPVIAVSVAIVQPTVAVAITVVCD